MKGDRRLLERARRWDEVALAQIYDMYAPRIYRYVYRRIGGQQTAQDLTAETFHRFLIALKQGGGPHTYLSAWLYRVAHNLVVDFYRRRSRHELVTLDEALLVAPDHAVTRLQHREEVERARSALQQLTPLQQQVLALRFLEELSLQEVAQVLDKTVNAVKALQHRALTSLRRILEVADETP